MTLDAYFPKKRGRPPKPVESDERQDRRRYYAEQRRLRQEEMDEPLSEFDIAARIEALWRKQ